MKCSVDDAIRIARRWSAQGTSPSPAQIAGVFDDLAKMPDPDTDQMPADDEWLFESDGDGPAHKRPDQYILGPDGLERLADFHGRHAHKNARAASCTPRMIAALRAAEKALSGLVGSPDSGEALDALEGVRAALKAVRHRKSG